MAKLSEVMLGFFALLKNHREDGIITYLSGDVQLDDPVLGRFSGTNSFKFYAQSMRGWMQKYNAGVEPENLISAENGFALEYRFTINVEGERKDLPVAISADVNRDLVTGIRIYYSTWPLYGKHAGRSPLLPENRSISLPEPVERYMSFLSEGNSESMVNLFEENGYVREPSGSNYLYRGRERLLEFYGPALSSGGIPLKHCKAFMEGNAAAVEYFFSQWGDAVFPPEAGIAFYEFTDGGQIRAARIYDDGNPPF